MLKDQVSPFAVLRLLSPAAVSDNTAQVSQIIDTQLYASVGIAIATGSLADADATFDVKLDEGDAANLSDAAEVTAAAKLLGTKEDFDFSDDNATFFFGYRGDKRYIRLTITPSGNASAANLAAVAICEKRKVGDTL